MNILGFNSSGNQTSVSIMIDMEVNSFKCSHERKKRPDWRMFLDKVGVNREIQLKDIDVFAFLDCQSSYTATRTIASYLKGIATALEKPLFVIDDNTEIELDSSDVVKLAKEKFLNANSNVDKFHPSLANPSYSLDTKYKKIND